MLSWVLLVACATSPAPAAAPAEPPAEVAPLGPATVRTAFPPPPGFTRTDAAPGSFGAWLGDRPVLAADVPVTTHDGRTVGHHARVVDLPLVPGDLQQCADSAIRLRAEWQRSVGAEVMFHATSGDPIPWARFRDGETPHASGNRLAWRAGSTGVWEDYLARVFQWAGTDSMARLDTVPADRPAPGDVLVEGGFPGHAVVVLDVARRGDEVRLLLGEGFMPAQSFHVELGPDAGWWPWDGSVNLGHWAFEAEHLRRFR